MRLVKVLRVVNRLLLGRSLTLLIIILLGYWWHLLGRLYRGLLWQLLLGEWSPGEALVEADVVKCKIVRVIAVAGKWGLLNCLLHVPSYLSFLRSCFRLGEGVEEIFGVSYDLLLLIIVTEGFLEGS